MEIFKTNSPEVAGPYFLRAPPEEHLSAQDKHLLLVAHKINWVNQSLEGLLARKNLQTNIGTV